MFLGIVLNFQHGLMDQQYRSSAVDHLDGKLFVDYLSEAKRQRIRKRLLKDRRLQAVGA